MKRYPFIGVAGVITPPVQTMNALTGVLLDLDAFAEADGDLGDDIDISEGMTLQNAGATARLAGNIVVFFHNTDTYGGADLVVTPAVTAVIAVPGDEEIAAVPTSIAIPPGDIAMIGPFSRANEDVDQIVNFTFTGTEGRCYAVSIR